MLRFLCVLVFTWICAINCDDNCPAYSQFPNYSNKNISQSLFNGIFTLAYTSSNTGLECHKIKYEMDANSVTIAYSEFPNCCLTLKNFQFNSDKIHYTIGPFDDGTQQWCPWISEDYQGSMKVLTTTGTGDNLCLVLAVCEPAYYGIMVMCRGVVPQLLTIQSTLTNLLGLVGLSDITNMQTVSQASCAVGGDYCPEFI